MITYVEVQIHAFHRQVGVAERLTSRLSYFTRGEKPRVGRPHNLYRLSTEIFLVPVGNRIPIPRFSCP
jgi:hypothetical protein